MLNRYQAEWKGNTGLKKAAVHNLGCKVNSYELDLIVQQLRAAGYEIVPFESKADLYIVNTCTVTNIADRKSRQMLHKAKKGNPDAIVAAVGCYVDTDRERLEKDPLVDLCIGNSSKEDIVSILKNHGKLTEGRNRNHLSFAADRIPPVQERLLLNEPGRTRADIKIQDGCNQFCTYCIIPYARGRIRSRNPDEIVEEAKLLAAEGVKEVVLTGIHISSYGREKGLEPDEELLKLLIRIQMIAGIERIRLGSLEPRIMTERFVSGIRKLSKVCPHFHLSLQSGCNATLRRMNRHYTAEEYQASVELLRNYYDRPAITTDIIVGFAGETEEEFRESESFCREIGFYEIHVFKYSVRRGTAAARMPGQCSPEVKADRSNIMLALTHGQAMKYRESFIGEQDEILLEKTEEVNGASCFTGHTMRYVEGVIPAGDHYAGELVKGKFRKLVSGTDYVAMLPVFRK